MSTALIVDLNAPLSEYPSWKVVREDQLSNRVVGQFEFEPQEITLYMDDEQKLVRHFDAFSGYKLREKLRSSKVTVFNANLLDFCLANPNLIPEEWKKPVFFWGTIYRNSNDGLLVRCLCWRGDRWDWSHRHLSFNFNQWDVAAVQNE